MLHPLWHHDVYSICGNGVVTERMLVCMYDSGCMTLAIITPPLLNIVSDSDTILPSCINTEPDGMRLAMFTAGLYVLSFLQRYSLSLRHLL